MGGCFVLFFSNGEVIVEFMLNTESNNWIDKVSRKFLYILLVVYDAVGDDLGIDRYFLDLQYANMYDVLIYILYFLIN